MLISSIFDDDQLEWITQKLVQNIPGKDMNMIFNILLQKLSYALVETFLK